jgi:hypothetical protein
MISKFSQLTGLNYTFSLDCLQQSEWSEEKAIVTFNTYKVYLFNIGSNTTGRLSNVIKSHYNLLKDDQLRIPFGSSRFCNSSVV